MVRAKLAEKRVWQQAVSGKKGQVRGHEQSRQEQEDIKAGNPMADTTDDLAANNDLRAGLCTGELMRECVAGVEVS